jgi:hypothetical protein
MRKIMEDISVINLFPEMPTISFYPHMETCHDPDGKLNVLNTREKKVVTLDIGPFRAKEKILYSPEDGTLYVSEELRSLTPYRCTYGYDVLVNVGYALFIRSRSEQEIIKELKEKNITISDREISFLGKKFIIYLALAHKESRERLKEEMAMRGGYILHLDGTCEGDSPHLFTGLDGIAELVLDNIKLPSEKADLLIPFFKQIKEQYGDPIALVHDMGKGIMSAIEAVFPGKPDFICHFHFLRDIGKDLFEKEYKQIRNRLKKYKIRPLLRRRKKTLKEKIDDESRAIQELQANMKKGQIEPSSLKEMPEVATYTMIHWAFDISSQLQGYGFPFDRSHLVFYQRLKMIHSEAKEIVEAHRWGDDKINKPFYKIFRPLNMVMNDQGLKKTVLQMEEKTKVFDKLRKALCIALPEGKKGLNDDGEETDIRTIEEKVKDFREEITTNKRLWEKDDYKKMVKQIDKYWEKLFADPMQVNTPNGPVMIQPQRTNNILERFFRDLKRKNRKKSGTGSLNKTLKTILADTPLVKNLENKDYLRIILDDCHSLEERFEKIDSELVLRELKRAQQSSEGISPEMKKIIREPNLPKKITEIFA